MPLLGAMSGDKPLLYERLVCDTLRERQRVYAYFVMRAIAKKVCWYLGLDIDPETQITVTCGSTEAMASVMLATVDDQVLF
ncbi:hypothetical protein [Nostoc sp. UIC 10607]|uniref:hypothetical protein n=1 Tax=Nostoc sp. UIC 10607 TaxID=3045935 RepID=UPI00399F3193